MSGYSKLSNFPEMKSWLGAIVFAATMLGSGAAPTKLPGSDGGLKKSAGWPLKALLKKMKVQPRDVTTQCCITTQNLQPPRDDDISIGKYNKKFGCNICHIQFEEDTHFACDSIQKEEGGGKFAYHSIEFQPVIRHNKKFFRQWMLTKGPDTCPNKLVSLLTWFGKFADYCTAHQTAGCVWHQVGYFK